MKQIEFLKNNNVDVDKGLELLGDIETYNETLKEFLNGLDEKVEMLTKYKVNEDMANYAIYAHSLKSDCKYFGFMDLAEESLEHELKGKDGDVSFVRDNFAKYLSDIESIKKLVMDYLEEDNKSSQEETNNESNEVIIVADDSEVIRTFVKKAFLDKYQILFAEDGEETLTLIKVYQEQGVKAILLDLNMPKVSGFEVLDYLQENNLFMKMPVTIISGDTSSEAINRAFNYPIVDMINKPFSEEKIKEAINKMIN